LHNADNCFFISNHGYGHVMRNISTIAWMLEHTDDPILLVTAAQHLAAARDYASKYVRAEDL
jgi:hypothetical protein